MIVPDSNKGQIVYEKYPYFGRDNRERIKKLSDLYVYARKLSVEFNVHGTSNKAEVIYVRLYALKYMPRNVIRYSL
jgi:hypothetical protein